MYFIYTATQPELDSINVNTVECTYLSLFRMKDDAAPDTVMPYLFHFEELNKELNPVMMDMLSNTSGVIIYSPVSLEEMYRHLRRFLIVKDEEGKRMYFKFYDPQVMRIFLPTCDEGQLKELFGPVESFIVDGETKEEAIRFWQENGILKQQSLSPDQVFGNPASPLNHSRQFVNTG